MWKKILYRRSLRGKDIQELSPVVPLEIPLYRCDLRVVRIRFESEGIFGKKVHTLGLSGSFKRLSLSNRSFLLLGALSNESFGKKLFLSFEFLRRGFLCILLKNQDPRLWESEITKRKQSSLEQLKKKIKNLEEFFRIQLRKMPPTPQNLLLDPDEEVKLRGKACYTLVEEYFPMEFTLWDFLNGRQEMLFDVYLTNKRLILLHSRLFTEDIGDMPLERVRMVSVEEYPETNFSLLKIEFEMKRRRAWYDSDFYIEEFVLLDAECWKEEIINLRATKILRRERGIVIDFSFIREYLDRGGIILQTIKCPNCGAPISLPRSGGTIQCSHCGATIYAQDVFEKIKQMFSER